MFGSGRASRRLPMTSAVPPSLPTNAESIAPRLRGDMSSRKLIVLAFVTRYVADHPGSPSYGEIARGCDVSRSAAKRIVRALVRDGKLVRLDGARRGLMLPSAIDAALAQLQSAGYRIDEDARSVAGTGTKTTLPRVPELGDTDMLSVAIGAPTLVSSGDDDGRLQSSRGPRDARDRGARTPQGAGRVPRRAGGKS